MGHSISMDATVNCLFLLALGFASSWAQINPCAAGWSYYNGACYGFGQDSVTWAAAEEVCRIYNAKLAEIETAEENTFVQNMAKNAKAPNVWLGGTDIFDEGNWQWLSTGEALGGYTDWAPNEPNHFGHIGGEDCLQFRADSNYKWNDASCKSVAYFICEGIPSEEIIG